MCECVPLTYNLNLTDEIDVLPACPPAGDFETFLISYFGPWGSYNKKSRVSIPTHIIIATIYSLLASRGLIFSYSSILSNSDVTSELANDR